MRPDSEGFEDLALAFDLEASILSAEATVLGAIERKASRGSHQRSDFPEVNSEIDCTFRIALDSNHKPVATRHELLPLTDELKACIERTKEIDTKGKLLE